MPPLRLPLPKAGPDGAGVAGVAAIVRALCLLSMLAGAPAADELLPDDGVPVVVPVGAGSYASRPPRDQNKRPYLKDKAGWGDDSQIYSHMRLYVTPGRKGPVPSTKWWTSLVSQRWSGDLWSYPAKIRAVPSGVEITFPHTWQVAGDGKTAKMVSTTSLLVGGSAFAPLDAEADAWSDWMVRFRMPDAAGHGLNVTTAHGMPFTWIECDGVDPWVAVGQATLFGPGASAAADRLGVEIAGDCYGIYGPSGTTFTRASGRIVPTFPGKARFLAIAPLMDKADLDRFAAQAAVVPRTTRITWAYDPAKASVATTWTIEAVDLDGKGRSDVLQGWIPHHYQPPAKAGFTPDGARYPTPRGELRLAVGKRFEIAFPFVGLLPEYPAPAPSTGPDAFRPEVMQGLIRDHLGRPGYGSETYWGGKMVLLLARYMELARQMGMKEETAVLRDRAAEAVRNWLTFTPGEGEHFFAWYPNWGSLVGCRSRDNANPGVDILQDHHMCYGYHVYAAALIMFQDAQFAKDWGPMARLVARDYAEWDENSTLFCRFRNLDAWCGHSWSGGMGSDDGNGQESSSEAMQGYGAMFLLGEAMGDKAMRDAAAFCWATEARGIAEYYFDRSHRNFPKDWPHAMISNIGTEGIGYWTWFSGDQFWMHAIQWLPMSPLLCYLSEDAAYAKSDFDDMVAHHEGGTGWNGYLGNDTGPSNIALNYLSGYDAPQAATVYDQLLARNAGGVKGAEPGPTYWRIQALASLGPQRFDAWTDVATSQVFASAGGPTSWVVFNASDKPREVRCFDKGTQVATFTAPPRRLSVMKGGTVAPGAEPMAPVPPPPTPTGLVIEPAAIQVAEHGTVRFAAFSLGQNGKRTPVQATWTVDGPGSISPDGTFTPAAPGNFDRPKVVIIAEANGQQARAQAAVEEARRVARIEMRPAAQSAAITLGVGMRLPVSETALDQFNAYIDLPAKITVSGPLKLEGAVVVTTGLGKGTVTTSLGGVSAQLAIAVVPAEQVDLAAGCPATASSNENGNPAEAAFDRDPKTRWASEHSDPQWLAVDLGSPQRVGRIVLSWENAHAKSYRIEASDDGAVWRTVHEQPDCRGNVETIVLPAAVRCRYLRLLGLTRSGSYGYSLWSFEAYLR